MPKIATTLAETKARPSAASGSLAPDSWLWRPDADEGRIGPLRDIRTYSRCADRFAIVRLRNHSACRRERPVLFVKAASVSCMGRRILVASRLIGPHDVRNGSDSSSRCLLAGGRPSSGCGSQGLACRSHDRPMTGKVMITAAGGRACRTLRLNPNRFVCH